jgi:hypothetical protein
MGGGRSIVGGRATRVKGLTPEEGKKKQLRGLDCPLLQV